MTEMVRREFLKQTSAAAAAVFVCSGQAQTKENPMSPIPHEALPYADTALEPVMSAKTFSFHHGKHYKAYVDKANELLAGSPLAAKPLEEIIRACAGKPDQAALFNNTAQAWNHAFFWKCMKPGGGGKPSGKLGEAIEKTFGGYDNFRKQFVEAGMGQFGSGWVWLVADGGALKIVKTPNADTPLAHGQTALLTADVWEHAYYLDVQNRRKDFLESFLDKLANWDFAASLYKA